MANLRKKAFKSGIEYLLDVIESQSKKGKRPKFSVPIRELERAADIDEVAKSDYEYQQQYGYDERLNPHFHHVTDDRNVERSIAPDIKEHSIVDFLESLQKQKQIDEHLYHTMLLDTMNQEQGIWPKRSSTQPFNESVMGDLNTRGEVGIRTILEQLKRGEFKDYKSPSTRHLEFSEKIQNKYNPTIQSILEDLLEQKSREK